MKPKSKERETVPSPDVDSAIEFNLSHADRPSFPRLHKDIARALGIAIINGQYAPGDILPGEMVASNDYGVSRPAYREAIRTLASKGIVESRPKIGTRVKPRKYWNLLDPDIVEWNFSGGRPDEVFVKSLFELRMIVEPSAAALAAQRHTPEQLSRLKAALSEMKRYTLANEKGRQADRIFHHTILEASGNALLQTLSTGIGAAVLWTTIMKYRTSSLPRDPVEDHRAVYEAVAAGDGATARKTMEALVGMALDDTGIIR
ncbi:FadR/GntR family transcriptional regulator [uncultured Martelella sp.]|uniref:FadR/GntR family transcriptional regulator n=1 Tax=uncultured Martelella sp. TaxID=392331 RepID=UPI0029C7BB79|nr:FadR/GntR family transcriptional regulator [uncultured Martelella sp.]